MLQLILKRLIDREGSKAIVKLAVELGCTFIDTCDVSFSRIDKVTLLNAHPPLDSPRQFYGPPMVSITTENCTESITSDNTCKGRE